MASGPLDLRAARRSTLFRAASAIAATRRMRVRAARASMRRRVRRAMASKPGCGGATATASPPVELDGVELGEGPSCLAVEPRSLRIANADGVVEKRRGARRGAASAIDAMRAWAGDVVCFVESDHTGAWRELAAANARAGREGLDLAPGA